MRFYFDEGQIWQARKEEAIGQINSAGIPLVLFGASTGVNAAFLQDIRVPVQYLCDNNQSLWGQRQWGLEILPPARLEEVYWAYNVLVLVPYEHEIIPQLRSLPVPPQEIFRLDFYYEEPDTVSYFQSVQRDMEKMYGLLGDQLSKDTFEAVIHYRINRDPDILKNVEISRERQYFPECLGGKAVLRQDEVFVDAGAYTGDTVQEFLTAVNGQYSVIHAFEPNARNFEKLSVFAADIPRMSCYHTGIGDKKSTLCFSSTGKSSHADESGETVVPVDTLDALLDGAAVTYLKMDIEGMECAGLRGAKKLIQTHRPNLAICTYHRNADMVEVPRLIKEIDPNYTLYFRHYSHALPETICYAIH